MPFCIYYKECEDMREGVIMKPNLISWEEAEKYVYHSGILVLDLRDKEAYEKGHISGAWNISYDDLMQDIEKVRHFERIILYCDYGNHSLKAAKVLADNGMWASSVAGGYEGRYGKRH